MNWFKTQGTNDLMFSMATMLSEREIVLCGKTYNLGFLHQAKRANPDGAFDVFFETNKPEQFLKFLHKFQFGGSFEPELYATHPV